MGDYVRVNEKQEVFFFRLFAFGYLAQVFYLITPLVDFAHIQFSGWLRWTGGVITCVGIILFGWAHQMLGQNWTAILALSKKHEMVQNGHYRYIRHPMYSSFFIIGIGFGLLSANWLAGIIYLGPLLVMYMTRVSTEEKMMLDRFGDPYHEYMKRTGRLFPSLWT